MAFADDEEDGPDLATARGRDWPSVRQYNIFLKNRVGALLNVVRRFEVAHIRIVSLTVVESADCAIIRMVLSDPERAVEVLERARLPYTESDLVVVKVPDGPQPLLEITRTLLAGEINIHYAYPLLMGIGPMGYTALALHVEDHEEAVKTLQRENFTIFSDADLEE